MNQTSRTDDVVDHPGWNQNPPLLSAEETTRQDLNGIVNLREQRDHTLQNTDAQETPTQIDVVQSQDENAETTPPSKNEDAANADNQPQKRARAATLKFSVRRFLRPFVKFASFVGPGFLVAVAYIDPGNYATDVAAGAESRYALLFVVLMSNLFAVFLQTLCIKLGSVTGLSLAENCRVHLPKWMNMALYILAESAIVATDIAEV
jgi:metal iron transporter